MAGSFEQLRVVSFESRRAAGMGALIERFDGRAISAPSLRELPHPESPQADTFATQLLAGKFDMVIFLTGVGARTLMSMIERTHPRDALLDALGKMTTIARGPKPVAAMREWRLTPTIEVPEPNTWRDIVTTLDAAGPLAGKRIAVQEYGVTNERLLAALRDRGADVLSVPIYGWALPENLAPLRSAIEAIVAGEAEVMLFTSAQQVRHVLQVAADMGLEQAFRDAARTTVIGSIGPTCSETLVDVGLGFDFEPDGVHMGNLVRGLARCATMLLTRKRSSHAAGVDTTNYRRIDIVWPAADKRVAGDPLHDSPFMRACRREPVPYTPIWLMRQAGRYQRAYRDIRAKASFLELCKTPQLAVEVTLMAVDQLDVDAAIIFADILLIVEPMGVGLSFNKGEGPAIARPVRTREDVARLRQVNADELGFVYDALRLTRQALKPDVPLIGFCGAPFTVASYMVEGGSSRNFVQTKSLMYRDAGAWHALMDHIVVVSAAYLNRQIEAGAQVLQVFDSWVGCLNEADYRTFVLPHSKKLLAAITPGVPVIHFGADSAMLLPAMRQAGGDVIGLDWRVNLGRTWASLGHDVAVQGNLDPAVLFATPGEIERQARVILDQAAGRPGHIFNLGHGILPETPVDHVTALVDFVHEYSAR